MRTSILTIAAAAWATYVSAAVQPVRTMYLDATAKEQAVRKALADPTTSEVVLKAVHEAVSAYESLVRHYPNSSYCDDALWLAGRLELDAFARFHQAADRDAAVRLLTRLKDAYPASRLARQAPALISRAGSIRAVESASPSVAPASRSAESVPVSSSPAASPGAPVVALRAVHRTVLPDVIRITLDLEAEVPFHDERIANPDRVFIDLSSTRPVPSLADRTVRFDGDGDIVRQVRVGRHPNSTTRVVLDATGIAGYSVYPVYGPYRLVIDCLRVGKTTTAALQRSARAAAVLPSRPVATAPTRPPSAFALHRLAIADARLAAEAEKPAAVETSPAPASAPTAAPVTPATTPEVRATPPPAVAGITIARQLGLGVSRIVIDPGHGGHDPGAKGKGVTEAELVLDVALRLEKLLSAVPGVEVILTRRTDEFVPLQDRTAIANREGADLFLSIHANASPSPSARGVETYFLNFATNLSAAAVAARENAASGQAMGALPDFVKAIALNNKLDESKDFAAQVQKSMVDTLRGPNKSLKNLGVKQAPFVVLIGAAMPSVLAEISFVTNSQEARLLKSNAYRQKIAEALFNAIRRYQTSLKQVQTVAQQ